ncbi:alpha/beta hydrolase [Prosthecobacter dejongeii]|uniref:Acetyl esterase/lipase n=1 Tax=Prosthecobacter dejongeii TaxID=48465 RepID=A0A7W8DN92_9BACT|nr:alpha/beta hydrolase [Prosthecobacter dejongeii]MBB5036123.1 acetyl esterase/lipase [Prosthecobacter dejongeii]
MSFASLCRTWVLGLSLFTLSFAAAENAPPQVLKDLPYKTGTALSAYEAERCLLDLYLPVGAQNFPTLVWLHGGGITAGSKDGPHQPEIARHFAQAGIAVASISYRLSPKAKFPAYIEDTAAAFAWVKKHIAEHGGDADRVFLGGHSAGAYLALMAGLDDQYLAAQGLKLADIAGLVPVAGQTLTHYTIRLERGLPKNRLIADAAAPLNHARKDAPPMLILYADKDMALRAEENELLAAALRQEGHPHLTVKKIKNRDHGSVAHEMAKAGDAGFQQVVKFIQAPKR